MRKIIYPMLLCILLLLGCEVRPDHYVFSHPIEEIQYIELIENFNNEGQKGIGTDETKFYVIGVLNTDQSYSFMEKIHGLETKERMGGPLWGLGEYIARVVYQNGDIELLGSSNIEFIPSGDKMWGYGSYYFRTDEFETIFKQYVEMISE